MDMVNVKALADLLKPPGQDSDSEDEGVRHTVYISLSCAYTYMYVYACAYTYMYVYAQDKLI